LTAVQTSRFLHTPRSWEFPANSPDDLGKIALIERKLEGQPDWRDMLPDYHSQHGNPAVAIPYEGQAESFIATQRCCSCKPA
jgi:hypothetical protein